MKKEMDELQDFFNDRLHLDYNHVNFDFIMGRTIVEDGNIYTCGHDHIHEKEYINTIEHVDLPATIAPDEAAELVSQRWASRVEKVANEPFTPTFLSLSRHTDVLHTAILEVPLVGKLKDEGVDVQPEWTNGAFVLTKIEPDEIDLKLNPLYPRHVLVKEEDLLELLGALEHLRYELRKLKPDGLTAIAGWPHGSSEGFVRFNVNGVCVL